MVDSGDAASRGENDARGSVDDNAAVVASSDRVTRGSSIPNAGKLEGAYSVHTCIHRYIHTYIHAFMHRYIHACMHAFMYA